MDAKTHLYRDAVADAVSLTGGTRWDVADAVLAIPHPQVEHLNAVADSMQHFADVAERVERRNNELAAEVDLVRVELDQLRAGIEALGEEHHGLAMSDNPDDPRQICAECAHTWPCRTRIQVITLLAGDD